MDAIALLFQLGLGPWLTPLRLKVPVLDSWPDMPPVDEQRVREWLGLKYNVGFRCGSASGLLVIDDDQAKNNASGFIAPPTGLIASTPGGGRHFFYRCPTPAPHNSASKLAPFVDVRAAGGQVCVAPSVGPGAGTAYRWISTDAPGTLPDDVLAVLLHGTQSAPVQRAPISGSPPVLNTGSGYVAAALHGEIHRVRNATPGSRNDALNAAAFNLGQMVASGMLPEDQVRDELTAAAAMAGLTEEETANTIASGLRGGALHPRASPAPKRGPSTRQTATAEAPATPAADAEKPSVLVPGSHYDKKEVYIEQGTNQFAEDVFACIDQSSLYRRGNVLGELHGGQFVVVSPDRMSSIVDATVKLTAGIKKENDVTIAFRTGNRSLSSILLAYGAVRGSVRELKHIARYPVCLGKEFQPAHPGWNAEHGVYLDCAHVHTPLGLEGARNALDDLVIDFPFATPADRAGFFGLLLTVYLRPAIEGPVPMHMLGAPLAGSGKSKLAEIVLGCGFMGRPLPALQLGTREEEREKRITGNMLSGDSVTHLDNLHDYLDSAALSSLLTCAVYRARPLGHSTMVDLPNDSTVVGSGNNVHTAHEMARRIVPIMLQPATEHPEDRQDYKYPDLLGNVVDKLASTRDALESYVANWRANGRPRGSRVMGSYERWSAVVGGVMEAAGHEEYLSNREQWRGTKDDFSAELREFVDAWAARGSPSVWTPVAELFTLAKELDLFARQMPQPTDDGRKTAFGQKVMSAVANRVIGQYRIEVEGSGRKRRARLATA